jgi:hypothetical protein
MLNMAILAADIPITSQPDRIETDYASQLDLIRRQYKDMTDEELPYANIQIDLGGGLHISLPHAGQIPLQITLEEYYRFTLIKLRQSA